MLFLLLVVVVCFFCYAVVCLQVNVRTQLYLACVHRLRWLTKHKNGRCKEIRFVAFSPVFVVGVLFFVFFFSWSLLTETCQGMWIVSVVPQFFYKMLFLKFGK